MRRVVLLALIWGWSFLLIKVALGGMTPATVAFARIALGTVVMLAVLKATGASLPRDLRSWRHFAVMGLAYSAVPFTLLAWGEQHITSALTAVVNATTGLFTAVAAAIGLGERLRRPQVAGLVIGFGGVAVASGTGTSDFVSSSGAGIAAALAASACYGFSFVYAQRHLTNTAPLVAACGQLVTGAVLSAPLALATSVDDGFSPTPRQLAAVALLGAVGTGIAYVVNYRSIADVGSTRASLVTYLVPIVAVTVGVVFLHERFHVRLVVGGALTIAGMAMIQERFRRLRPGPVVAAVLALLLLGGCAGGGGSGGGGSCGPEVQEALDPGSVRHVLPGAPEPSYATDPPTSGPHLAGGGVGGVQSEPLPRPVQVAVLEEGGVVVQHKGLDATGRARLEALAADDVAVAPNPELPSPVVATAWQHRLVCGDAGEASVEAVERFVAAHRGGGPGH
ncbi:MAG TPA: EamA family transporter [Acidimicrobiales bacterium]|nr:EamA family transporter [Acidimicrobiales bacterium]